MSEDHEGLKAVLLRWPRSVAPAVGRLGRVVSRFASTVRTYRKWTVIVAAAVIVTAVASGAMDSSNETLLFMGFDADRAQLITSLLIAGVAAAAATLATNRSGQATIAGLGGFAALFGPTFLAETRNASTSTGVMGSFSLTGWLLSVLTLLTFGVISSWAGAAPAQLLRPGLIEAGSAVRDALRSRRLDRHILRRPLTVAGVLILLLVTVPVFGDMVNYTPDAPMLHGGAPPVGLIFENPTGSPASAAGSPSPAETGAGTEASAAPQPTPSTVRIWRPWLSWRPSGKGSVSLVGLPAPWTGSPATINYISVYTPPGYDPKSDRRYPVLYEAPFEYDLWDKSINLGVVLDTLIDTGAVPPMLVVFINTYQAPIDDTECANSVDGRQWVDTYISQTVVAYVDSHYLTIARGAARAFFGFSDGGYCAAILPLLHPSVFGTGIAISGYYRAGAGDATSGLPFAGDPAALAAASPITAATKLSAADRAKLFFIVVSQQDQPYWGWQATDFEGVLKLEGYSYLAVDSAYGHGWDEVRHEFPGALTAWATHLADLGVF